ncbi:F-box protein At1g70590-like [Nicotiana sylvestris]|uniref:F-box protein At1g70590-like isoform X1 n=1 Tax=Nicotiana sylvestris TaxID=4096 RepID=A0A1U7XX97_NICSY|nr:PREDICTED: F-box protein At1g70590-like isoform X1 [Nicotiana sylvestris]
MAAAGPTEYQMMNQRTWPHKSDSGPRFTAFSFMSKTPENHNPRKNNPTNHNLQFNPISSSNQEHSTDNFTQLPNDVLLKIAATFTLPNLRAASQVCKSWCDALRPLREAMLFLKYGKNFKHGRGGVEVNLNKALDSFLQGAARGSTLAMVDAGLLYWEMGRKEQGVSFYRKAAVLGDPAGQCNLGISLLEANPPDIEEAIKWMYKASIAGYVRAQYQLALCLHKGRGPSRDLKEAARWYLKAAEGGYVRAMYNTAICYSVGEGLSQSHKLARKWMKRAADRGHSKAQFEHGLSIFSEGNMMKAVVYLELATRAGETAADHVKYVILQQISTSSRDRAMLLADNWHPLPSSSR